MSAGAIPRALIFTPKNVNHSNYSHNTTI